MRKKQAGSVPVFAVLLAVVFLAAVVYLLIDGPSDDNLGPNIDDENNSSTEEEREFVPFTGPIVDGRDNASTSANRTEIASTQEAGGITGGVFGRVIDPASSPIADAKVILTKRLSPQEAFLEHSEKGGLPRFSVVTDSSGKYQFPKLTAGVDFDVWVFHPDFSPLQAPPLIALENAVQEIPDIVLRQGFRVYGQITDTAGNPLPAEVELIMQPRGYFPEPEAERLERDREEGRLRTVPTDNNGYYEVKNLPSGVWTLKARAEGFAMGQIHPVVLMSNAKNMNAAMEKEQNLELGSEFIINGVVIDESRQPVPNASINVSRARPRPMFSTQTVSDETGAFVVNGLQDGVYTVTASAAGYSRERVSNVQANQTDVEVILYVKGSVLGRVTDPNGSPVPSFTLELMKVNKGTAMYGKMGIKRPYNHQNGNFEMNDLDKGTYVLLVTADGYSPTYSPGFYVDRGAVVRGIDVSLRRGAKVFGYVQSIKTGGPLAGADIILRGPEYKEADLNNMFGGYMGDPNNIPSMGVKSDSRGYFELKNAVPQLVQIEVSHPTHLSEFVTLNLAEAGEQDAGTISLYMGGTVTGIVTDSDGNPLAGGTVYLNRPPEAGGWFTANRTLDARGRYQFRGLRAGNYEISATAPQQEGMFALLGQKATKIYVPEGEQVEQNLVVKK